MKTVRLVFLVFVLVGCTRTGDKERISASGNLGYFELPHSYELFKYSSFGSDSSSLFLDIGDINIFTRINASCSSCLPKIGQLNDLYRRIQKIKTVNFYVVCHSKDSFDLLKFLFESHRLEPTDYTLILDHGNINDQAKNILELNETIVTNSDLNILFQQEVIGNGKAVNNLLGQLKKL